MTISLAEAGLSGSRSINMIHQHEKPGGGIHIGSASGLSYVPVFVIIMR